MVLDALKKRSFLKLLWYLFFDSQSHYKLYLNKKADETK